MVLVGMLLMLLIRGWDAVIRISLVFGSSGFGFGYCVVFVLGLVLWVGSVSFVL